MCFTMCVYYVLLCVTTTSKTQMLKCDNIVKHIISEFDILQLYYDIIYYILSMLHVLNMCQSPASLHAYAARTSYERQPLPATPQLRNATALSPPQLCQTRPTAPQAKPRAPGSQSATRQLPLICFALASCVALLYRISWRTFASAALWTLLYVGPTCTAQDAILPKLHFVLLSHLLSCARCHICIPWPCCCISHCHMCILCPCCRLSQCSSTCYLRPACQIWLTLRRCLFNS